MLDRMWDTRAKLDRHRDHFYDMRNLHRRGVKPDFAAEWTARWTIEQYDVAHLREAMPLSGQIVSLEKRLSEVRADARRKGIIAFEDQESGFPSTQGQYPPSHEQMLKDRTPKFAINRWLTACQASDAMLDPTKPSQVQILLTSSEGAAQPELEVWDSNSCAAFGPRRDRIDRMRIDDRLGGTEKRHPGRVKSG